jgi:1-phosphofructokinase
MAMKNGLAGFDVVTVTLNPAIDRTVTIPNFSAGAVNRVEQERSAPGGKGVNVASALADCGHHVAVTGFLGCENSALFEALFERKKIEDHFVRIAGRTRVGIKITDPVRRQTTDINFPGPAPAPADLDALRQRLGAIDSTWGVVTGSLPPGVDATIYRDIVKALKARGSKVVLDTSGEALRHAIEVLPHVIKPNIHELETFVGNPLTTDAEVIAAAKKLASRGIELVAVSMGADGACFATEAAVVIARPPDVEVKSTVGAGDAMVAGILSAQLRRLPLAESARLATAFSLEVLRRGESGVSSPASIDSSMSQVRIEKPA